MAAPAAVACRWHICFLGKPSVGKRPSRSTDFILEVLIEGIFVETNEVLLLMKSNDRANLFDGLRRVLERNAALSRTKEATHRFSSTCPPCSVNDPLSFATPAVLCFLPWSRPLSMINGTKQMTTNVNFHPAANAIASAVTVALMACRTMPVRAPVKP